jgi:predicted N-acetyltransferase YhbS
VGHAFTFERPIISESVETSVMALSQVCVAPAHRGKGLGAELVRRAFQRIRNGEFPVSIFQTTIPVFYQRLGATVVNNRFFNSRNQEDPDAKPWRDSRLNAKPLAGLLHRVGYPYAADPTDAIREGWQLSFPFSS